ncbi:MAG: glycosyltransferase [Lachnospiraceae bacterium]|nr:glycosyltransferase [Lachnospiraceae bacterium]
MFEEKISIVVPVYNVEKYLDNTITHILNQTYKNLEVILVDDGSTDSSGQIIDKYASMDSRIVPVHKPNGGSSTARNKGIELASGDYIGFLDADDTADETMYEALYKAAKENDATIVQCMSRDFDEDGNLLKDAYKSSGKVTFIPKDENFRLLMMHEGDSSFCTKLIKADFCKQFRFPENKLNEDFELVMEMLLKVDGVYSVEEAHYDILIRSGSNQRSGFKPNLYEAVIDNSDMALNICESHFPQWKQQALRFWFFQRLMFLLHIPVELMKKDNTYYMTVIKQVKEGRSLWKTNPFLLPKEKRNLMILSVCPKFSKRVHGLIMKIKRK